MKSARVLMAQLMVVIVILLAGACSDDRPEPAATALTPLKTQLVPVEVINEQRPIEVYGIVRPSRQVAVSSRVMGPVLAVAARPGDVVRQGQKLLEIQGEASDGQLAQARGGLAQAAAGLVLAERNFQRFEALHDEGAASELELDMARAQLEQARGAVGQAEGAVQAATSVADEAVVVAPFAGRVVERMVEVGDLVAPGRPLVRIEALAGQQIWLTVRAADRVRIAKSQPLEVSFDARPGLGTVTGVVQEIVPAADSATHTFTVKVGLDDLAISSGLGGRAVIPGDEVERLVVPGHTVHRRGGLELVVLCGTDGLARTRAVKTGKDLGQGRIEILSGLQAGEQVALDAPGPVADGTPVQEVGS